MTRYFLKRQVLILLFLLFTLNLFSQTFVEQTGITLPGVSGGSVAWGDYDNDGNLDILITGWSGSCPVSKIYRNNSDNSFTEQTGIVLTGVSESSIAWGDYDNDGDLDILLTGRNNSGQPVSEIYRNDGNNSFTEQTNIELTGVCTGSVAWGDYDNDGDLDILLTGWSGSSPVSKIYRNNSNNSFTEQTGIALTGVQQGSVAWGDYDNDSYLDILLTGWNSYYQRIPKIYRNNGDNSFSEQTGIPLSGVNNSSVAWGDYDNDGDLDIVLTGNIYPTGVSEIYRNNGDNTFTEQSGIKLTGVYYSSVTWGDYDNDGDLDILLTGWSGSGSISRINCNNGDNSFTEQTGIALTGVYWSSVAWGDYDNDGDLDILLAGETGSGLVSKIYRNEMTTPNVKPAIPSNLKSVINNGAVTFTWDKPLDMETPQKGLSYNLYVYETGQSNYECPPHAFKQADAKNGRRLIAKSGAIQWSPAGYTIKDLPPGKTYYWTVQAVDACLQGGNFSAEQSFTMPFYRPYTPANCIAFTNMQATQATATWANGGGTKRAVFIKDSATGTADPVDNTTYNVNDITTGGWKCVYNGIDNFVLLTGLVINKDYLLHVCEYNGMAGNENYLRFAAYQNPAVLNTIWGEQSDITLTGVRNSSAAWGDYDNDGYLDILLTGGYSFSDRFSKIYRNDGDNKFTEQTDISLKAVDYSSVAWGDYDNDGDLDILLTGATSFDPFSPVSKIYRNDGNNSFTEQTGFVLTGVFYSSVAWGDYDNDGDLDILLTGSSSSGPVSKVYRNNGDNTFTEQIGIALAAVYMSSVAWGDYDNDGDPDILLTGHTGSKPVSKIYRNNGHNSFTEQTSITLTEVYYSSVAWGDYNNDGDLDILLTGYTDSAYISKIYRNNGNNSFTEQTGISLTGVYISSAAWGDYDNDGDLDILLTGSTAENPYNPVAKIYCNNGDNSFTEQTSINLTKVNNSSVAWGDYDNDNDLDILLTGNSISDNISKLYRNEILNQNTKPSVPAGLQSHLDNDCIVFKWNKSSDNTTPTPAISYNLRVGTSPGGNEVKSGQANSNGKLLLPNINNLINDTCIKLKLPLNKYYWSVQAVDKGGLASSFATEEITPVDSIQAKDLQAFIKTSNSILIRWKNGNGLRRVLFGRFSSPAEIAKPVNGTIYHAEPYFGQGDKIGATDWYCMYNGKADSAIIYGIGEGYSYDIQVVEYIEVNGLPKYFNTTGNGNPGVFSSSLYSEQTGIALAGVIESSVAFGDYDNDGYLDILLTGHNSTASYGSVNISKIYHNNGDNSFAEQTGIALTGVQWGSVAWGDYDNDSDLDILLTGWSSSGPISKIYRNNGDNTFTDQTGIALSGVYVSSAAWGDYDNDGDLDILLTGSTGVDIPYNYNPVSKIYRNNGDNSFAEQTSIVLTAVYWSSAAWGDYDNDGDLDILLTGLINPNQSISKIYRNNGDNTFTEQTSIALTGVFRGSMAWGDYDNDCDLDILLTGSEISKIYHNNNDNTFSEQTGIALTGVSSSSAAWGDYDNDGDLDILLTGQKYPGEISKIYRNNGNNSFTEQTGIVLTGVYWSSVAWGDYDNDGDLDIILTGYTGSSTILKIYRNNIFMKAGIYYANKKPAAPAELLAISQPNGIKLSWSHVKTDETSFKTMTYNVKVGTAPGKSDILPSQSNSVNGFRRVVAMGNAQLDTTFIIKKLPSGKYYWSVQAVDQGYQGGGWSAVDSFLVRNVQTFYSADTVCLGFPTNFTDQSVATDGIKSWKWDFKDGTTSFSQNPDHLYSKSGAFHVKLSITSNGGVKDSLEKDIIVKPHPTTGFTALNTCQGIPVTATNTTNNNGLSITSWNWNFGDGQTSTIQQPSPHGYLIAGDYLVKLKAIAGNGCADSITKTVTVINYPVAEITTNAPLIFCKGDSVTLSVGSNNNYTYKWLISGTAVTGANGNKYVAKLSGNYSVEVTNNNGNCKTTSSQVVVNAQNTPLKPVIQSDNYQAGKCMSDNFVVLNVSQTVAGYNYQWLRNGFPISNATLPNFQGTVLAGDYSVEANLSGCKIQSDIFKITYLEAPFKPDIYVEGPAVWYLACSNDSALQYKWYYNGTIIQGADKYIYVANRNLGQYAVSIANTKGCFTMSDVITIPTGATGIKDVDPFDGLKIYPNPTPGLFTIEMDNQIFGELLINIIAQEGKEILKIKFEKTTVHFSNQINLSGQPKGMYLINLLIDKYIANRKLIVE